MKLETVKPKKGTHFKTYKGTKKVPTKAEFLRRALKKAHGPLDVHEKWIDFIPGKFTVQLHGWFDEGSYGKGKEALTKINSVVKMALKNHEDPIIHLPKGKFHYDIRVIKKGAPVWFGFTTFRLPWTGTSEDKVRGTVKGYQSLVKGSKALNKFLKEKAEAAMTTEGTSERRDRVSWMKIKSKYWSPPGIGTPTGQPGIMIALEYLQPCLIHRRELDFLDITFLGKYFNGRYFDRLVERKFGDKFVLGFYLWRAKKCFDSSKAKAIFLGKKKMDPIEVKHQDDYLKDQSPLKPTWQFKRGGKILKT